MNFETPTNQPKSKAELKQELMNKVEEITVQIDNTLQRLDSIALDVEQVEVKENLQTELSKLKDLQTKLSEEVLKLMEQE
ncbi:MAG: hypothetical protein WCK37_04735 [Candidatus Falkowbacteria bacterium]